VPGLTLASTLGPAATGLNLGSAALAGEAVAGTGLPSFLSSLGTAALGDLSTGADVAGKAAAIGSLGGTAPPATPATVNQAPVINGTSIPSFQDGGGDSELLTELMRILRGAVG